MPMDASTPAETPQGNIQAHLLRATKFQDPGAPGSERPRDWSLFFFFRIMAQAEIDQTRRRISSGPSGWPTLKLDLADPALMSAGVADQGDGATPAPSPPAQAFRDWLKVLASSDAHGLLHSMGDLFSLALPLDNLMTLGGDAPTPAPTASDMSPILEQLLEAPHELWSSDDADIQARMSQVFPVLAANPAQYRALMAALGEHLAAPDAAREASPLAMMVLFEMLRQAGPALTSVRAAADQRAPSVLRAEKDARPSPGDDPGYDQTPITLAFTFPGLCALQLDATTLASFPDAFRQGMAARAPRLNDVGASAPETWEGELGLPSVHGYFTGGFAAPRPMSESFWKALRADIRAFNEPASPQGQKLRLWIGLLFRMLGMEIIHMELGQTPYEVVLEKVWPLEPRREHFGFRDGLSQPFVDLGLADPPPGGGTPSRRRTWTPAAPGEIFLDQPDEGGETQMSPGHETLRLGSTFLVFRKLEQDVQGFRGFLAEQRRGDPDAQEALAAQFVGRWKSGAPLVLAPRADRDMPDEAQLNDFLYRADDLEGRRCPIGAHVRRANPRDTGGRDEVRHHRILRRGMSYGGRLIEEGEPDDGEPRGLLFVAANARIDLQFEVIQADWINGGEFLGQVGAGRCPVIGAHRGEGDDVFQEAGGLAPVRGIPQFVTLRGGDYFFAPGISAIRGLAAGDPFPLQDDQLPFAGFSMGDAATPSLFSADRIVGLVKSTLSTTPVVRLQARDAGADAQAPETVAFVGQHADVKTALSNDVDDAGTIMFSVSPYAEASKRMTRGGVMLIATEGEACPARAGMKAALNAAWDTLYKATGGKLDDLVRGAAGKRLGAGLRRTAGARRIDLVDDLAAPAAHGVLADIYGLPGPDYLTEMAASLPFARQHVGDLPKDWLAALKGEAPADPGLTSLQVWSAVMVADLIGNLQSLHELQALSRQASSEMLTYIDGQLDRARSAAGQAAPSTLIEAFVANEQQMIGAYGGDADAYYKDVALILLEIIGSTLAVIPLTFASVMEGLLKFRIDLSRVLPLVGRDGVRRLIFESERLNPNIPVRIRRCAARPDAGNLSSVAPGDFVAALIAAANRDPRVFDQADTLSLKGIGPFDGPARNDGDYLTFGVAGSNKDCWGRERVAMPVLEEALWAAGRLQGLRRVAGPGGVPRNLARVTTGLPARFTDLRAPLK